MFPGKTEAEEFINHLETEYGDKNIMVGKMKFTFKVNEGETSFEYEFGNNESSEEAPKQEEAEETEKDGGEDNIEFNPKSLTIRCVPYEGNADGILYELTYRDEKKNVGIKYKYRLPEFNIDDDDYTNSKSFFEISIKIIKKLIKKLKKNI